jgi:hypothetical protein
LQGFPRFLTVSPVDPETQTELEATVAARRELGPAHDEELINGFLDRVGKEIDRRVDQKIAEQAPRKRGPSPLHPGTLGVSIPIIAIAGGIGGVAGLIVAFIALVIVFGVAELRR